MGPPFTNLFASCCTSPNFVFGARFATPHMALGPMCHLICWLLSCGVCYFAVLADRWQVILGEFPGSCTQCNNLALCPIACVYGGGTVPWEVGGGSPGNRPLGGGGGDCLPWRGGGGGRALLHFGKGGGLPCKPLPPSPRPPPPLPHPL